VPFQQGWKYCSKCQVLCWSEMGGVCQLDGQSHNFSGSGTYSVLYNDGTAPAQPTWLFCTRCGELIYGGTADLGTCPASGAHTPLTGDGAYDYQLFQNPQAGWKFCHYCRALFFPQGANMGPCPGNPTGGSHDDSQSGLYFVCL